MKQPPAGEPLSLKRFPLQDKSSMNAVTGVICHGHAHQVRQEKLIIRKISFYWKADDVVPEPEKGIKQGSD